MNVSKIIFSVLIVCQSITVPAGAKISSGLCKPYFASIKRSPVNLHVGPGKNYKAVSKYVIKNIPVLINAKYDHWRRITDPDGTQGWLHKNQLSDKRYVITIKDNVKLMSGTNDNAKVVAMINKNVTMKLNEIRGSWCHINCQSKNEKFKGWVKKTDVFGTFDGELGTVK